MTRPRGSPAAGLLLAPDVHIFARTPDSGGERQRVAIARALMNDPDLVLVDEPTASLDSARGVQVVQSLIREVKDRDKLSIMVTHDMTMARLADRVLEMHDGSLRQITDGD